MGSQHSRLSEAPTEAPVDAQSKSQERLKEGEKDEDSSSSSSSNSSPSPTTSFVPCDADWPYVWAMRDYQILDWRKGCPTPELIRERMLEQLQLPVEVVHGRLYLGDAACVADDNIPRLRALGITGILNVSNQAHARTTARALETAGIRVRHVPTLDRVDYPLLATHWEDVHGALRRLLLLDDDDDDDRPRRVVVHCHAGQNRAGLVAAAYLMITRRLSVLETVRALRRQRGNTALVNPGFQEQLVALARTLDLLGPVPGTPGSIVRQRPPPPPPPSRTGSSWMIVQKPVTGRPHGNKGRTGRLREWRNMLGQNSRRQGSKEESSST